MLPTARALTDPASGDFVRSMMWRRGIGDLNDKRLLANERTKKATQEEQDAEDEEARKVAMMNIIGSWQERLQLISVISTFFASTEAAVLVNTNPSGDQLRSNVLRASNACLLGALILHVYAAVLSFLAAFLLIRYKLREATREELIAEGIRIVNSPLQMSVHRDIERNPSRSGLRQPLPRNDGFLQVDQPVLGGATPIPQIVTNGLGPMEPPIFSANPHLEQVGLFRSTVSSHMLSRAHGICLSLAAVGFILAIVGIMCYAFVLQPRSVSIFTTACLGGATVSMVVLFV